MCPVSGKSKGAAIATAHSDSGAKNLMTLSRRIFIHHPFAVFIPQLIGKKSFAILMPIRVISRMG
jgi:hypothetical protein